MTHGHENAGPAGFSPIAKYAVGLPVRASDSAAGQTLTYSAAGLPAGLTISSSGLIPGTPTTVSEGS